MGTRALNILFQNREYAKFTRRTYTHRYFGASKLQGSAGLNYSSFATAVLFVTYGSKI